MVSEEPWPRRRSLHLLPRARSVHRETLLLTNGIAPGGMDLDPDKRFCVQHMREQKVTVVTAGAGAGKTYTILASLLDAVEYHGGSLDQCALITFTNQGADELR